MELLGGDDRRGDHEGGYSNCHRRLSGSRLRALPTRLPGSPGLQATGCSCARTIFVAERSPRTTRTLTWTPRRRRFRSSLIPRGERRALTRREAPAGTENRPAPIWIVRFRPLDRALTLVRALTLTVQGGPAPGQETVVARRNTRRFETRARPPRPRMRGRAGTKTVPPSIRATRTSHGSEDVRSDSPPFEPARTKCPFGCIAIALTSSFLSVKSMTRTPPLPKPWSSAPLGR